MEQGGASEDKRHCSVPHCPFRPWSGLSFHHFPGKDTKLCEKWGTACCIGNRISPFMLVCSNHFKQDEFFPRRVGQRGRFLKPGTVPSQHLPRTPTDSALLPSQVENVNQITTTRRSGRISRIAKEIAANGYTKVVNVKKISQTCDNIKKSTNKSSHEEADAFSNIQDTSQTSAKTAERNNKPQPKNTNAQSSCDEVKPLTYINGGQMCEHGESLIGEDGDVPVPEESYDRKTAVSMVLQELQNISLSREEKRICLQVVSQVISVPKESRSLINFLNSKLELKAFTGIHHELLESMAEAVSPYENNGTKPVCSLKERIVMTFCKLRLNLSFLCLGLLFSVNQQTCRLYFLETTDVLKTVLSGAVYWPTKDTVWKTIPSCFKEYCQTRVVLDLIEVTVEKPKCLQCSLRLTSQSKEHQTLKILTGIAPSGLITFISKPYGGQASNEFIVKESNLLDLLVKGEDALMVNEGFSVEKECAERGLELIRPPYLSNYNMLSAEDALTSMKLAAARVHVAEAVQRIKKFKILSSVFELSLLPCVSSIFVIIAATVNLSSFVLTCESL